jgi:hypothetical protein
MDSKVSFTGHIDYVTVGRALAMLGFVERLSCDFRDPYTLKALYVSQVRPKLEYAICVCSMVRTLIELSVCRRSS